MTDSTPTADREDGMLTRDRVRGDRLDLLYRQSIQSAAVSTGVAALLCTIYWSDADNSRVGIWLALVAISSTLRMVLFALFHRAGPKNPLILQWERPYLVTLMLSSLVWGVGSVWAMPKYSQLYEAVTFGFLMGIAGGALTVYSAIRSLALATVTAILLPLMLWMLAGGGTLRVCMAAGSLLFILSAWRATRVLSASLQQNFELAYELQEAKEAAERLASTDALTGLANRRAFFEQAAGTLHYCERNRRPIAAMLLDLDHFKRINDSYGHAVGDIVLQRVAQVLHVELRKSDVYCRLGGEEFAVLLPDTTMADARGVAEKLRVAISDRLLEAPVSAGGVSLTISIGVAEGGYDLDRLLERADAAMYRAKNAGRNRVEILEAA